MPVFWDVPRANLHAVVDVGAVVDWLRFQFKFSRDAKSSLAVLHNQNDMVTHFKASSWVSEAQGAVVSRGVTTVIVAQTKLGFLTGGRRASFHDLPQEEQDIHLEEAYGRATVALTRARFVCVIMGPLDMKGLFGAATVIGSLMYGAGHVFKGQANFYMHEGSFRNSPSDADFGQLLERSNCLTSPYLPPLAIAEALQDNVSHWYKIRRLHLIVVDTWSPWQYNTAQVRAVTDLMKHLADTPEMRRMVPLMPQGGSVPPRCRRFIYGEVFILGIFSFFLGGIFFLFLVPWSPGPLIPWCPGPLVPWSPGPLVPCSSGLLVSWSSVLFRSFFSNLSFTLFYYPFYIFTLSCVC